MGLHLMRFATGLWVIGVGLLVGTGAVLVIQQGWWIILAAVASLVVPYLIGIAALAILDRLAS
jgi:hypothetical protein